MAWIMALGKKV